MSMVYAFAALLLVSTLYEPMRLALHNLGEHIGGVGGIGGLVNLWNPESCSSLASKADAYCFHEGVFLGLTPFACVLLVFWILPFSIISFMQQAYDKHRGQRLVDSGGSAPDMKLARRGFLFIWISLSIIWFAVPLAQYSSSEFYQKDVYHRILAVAISASYPLSWHLSLVAVSVPQYIANLMGISRQEVVDSHKMVARSTLVWVALHVGGELTWFMSQGQLGSLLSTEGDQLFYIFGILTVVVLVIHYSITQIRHKLTNFKQIHSSGAAVLLLAAAAHWAPFTFFLIPAAGVHATSIALKLFDSSEGACSGENRDAAPVHAGRALACATVAATGAMAIVWKIRESCMMPSDAGLRLPFLFPPAALLAAFGAALLVSSTVIKINDSLRNRARVVLDIGVTS